MLDFQGIFCCRFNEMSKTKAIKSTQVHNGQTRSAPKDELIYQQIYKAIIKHDLAPGTKLPEDALAETFHVSRTIIRQALMKLTHEGLVTTAPKRGARVARPTIQEGKDIFEARKIIEVAALPLVIERIKQDALKQLYVLNKQQKKAQKQQDLAEAIRLSGDFHEKLIFNAGNQSLYEYLRRLVSKSSLIVAVYGSTQQHLPSCQGHAELLDYIADKNIQKSQEWMSNHLDHVENSLNFSDPQASNPDFNALFSTD